MDKRTYIQESIKMAVKTVDDRYGLDMAEKVELKNFIENASTDELAEYLNETEFATHVGRAAKSLGKDLNKLNRFQLPKSPLRKLAYYTDVARKSISGVRKGVKDFKKGYADNVEPYKGEPKLIGAPKVQTRKAATAAKKPVVDKAQLAASKAQFQTAKAALNNNKMNESLIRDTAWRIVVNMENLNLENITNAANFIQEANIENVINFIKKIS